MNKELDNSLLDFYIATLQSDYIKDLVIKYSNKYYKNIQNINIKAFQFETILKSIEGNNNFVIPKRFEEYESDNNRYIYITELINELIESFRSIDRIKMDPKQVFEEMEAIIDLLKVQELIVVDDKNLITLKYPTVFDLEVKSEEKEYADEYNRFIQELKEKGFKENEDYFKFKETINNLHFL